MEFYADKENTCYNAFNDGSGWEYWNENTVYSLMRDVVLWSDENPKGCSDSEFSKFKKILNIEQRHIDAHQKWVNEGLNMDLEPQEENNNEIRD